MKAVIDNTYVLRYVRWLKSNGICREAYEHQLALINVIAIELSRPGVLPGKVKWNSNRQRLVDYGISVGLPGVDRTTWCIYVLHAVMKKYGRDVSSIIDRGRIGNTTGNEMAQLFEKSAASGIAMEVDFLTAQKYANNGAPVAVCSQGKMINGKQHTGHVAVMAPSMEDIDKQEHRENIIVGQAGQMNGFYKLYVAFPQGWVTEPRFYTLPKVG